MRRDMPGFLGEYWRGNGKQRALGMLLQLGPPRLSGRRNQHAVGWPRRWSLTPRRDRGDGTDCGGLEMTRQYLIGELSVRLRPLCGLAPAAGQALALADGLCWESLSCR